MKTLLGVLDGIGKEQQDCVLVVITAASGSTPGRVGASMIVTAKGRRFGTIGGGAVEKKSEELAQKLLAEKRSKLERFRLHLDGASDIGMICGGENDVYFRYLSAEDEEAHAVIRSAQKRIADQAQAWLTIELTEGENGTFGLVPEEDGGLPKTAGTVTKDGRTVFAKKLIPDGKVYLFGAGHVASALAPLLVKLGFDCGVYDDREEFLQQDCFAGIRTGKIDPEDISGIAGQIGPSDYVCIMTHGHKDDFEIQRQVMKTPARYIGVIGSARKQRAAKEKLLALGYAEADFVNVVSPIGLNIGADTPEEIAVCIAAQLIMVRAGRGCGEKDWKR